MKWRTSISSFRVKTFFISLLILVALGSFIYTHYLILKIRENERSSIELWARALEYTSGQQNVPTRNLINAMIDDVREHPLLTNEIKSRWLMVLERAESDLSNAGIDFVATELILNNRFEIPSIVVNEDNEIIQADNIAERRLGPGLISEYAALNKPIRIEIGDTEVQQIYYGDSAVVRTLKYFPYIQFGLLALFLGLGYASFSSIKRDEQSKVWVGMARESAHQLGTPISSLLGWIAILRENLQDETNLGTLHELQKDVERLESIAERFNKIGSEPELKVMRAGPILHAVTAYMERRMPSYGQRVKLFYDVEMDARVAMNEELFKWAAENLIKNAIDALDLEKDGGYVKINSRAGMKGLIIDVEDNGRGIEKKNFDEVFNPGFSTKKRGWGLGLSLTRRIIEEYHSGSVYVLRSEPGKGTTFRIMLPYAAEK